MNDAGGLRAARFAASIIEKRPKTQKNGFQWLGTPKALSWHFLVTPGHYCLTGNSGSFSIGLFDVAFRCRFGALCGRVARSWLPPWSIKVFQKTKILGTSEAPTVPTSIRYLGHSPSPPVVRAGHVTFLSLTDLFAGRSDLFRRLWGVEGENKAT